jgi:hypothetical protein
MRTDARKIPRRKRATRKAGEGWAGTREPRGVIKRAAEDLRQGLQDTDLRARRPKQP